jgi:hypothetical protein
LVKFDWIIRLGQLMQKFIERFLAAPTGSFFHFRSQGHGEINLFTQEVSRRSRLSSMIIRKPMRRFYIVVLRN